MSPTWLVRLTVSMLFFIGFFTVCECLSSLLGKTEGKAMKTKPLFTIFLKKKTREKVFDLLCVKIDFFYKNIDFLWFLEKRARQICPLGTEHSILLFSNCWEKPQAPFQCCFAPSSFPWSFPQHYSYFFFFYSVVFRMKHWVFLI